MELNISPSKEYLGQISFRIYWFDLLAVQGTLKSLLQHHSSKASILRHSAFLMVQVSHLYMTNGKVITWTIWTFVGKVICLLFIPKILRTSLSPCYSKNPEDMFGLGLYSLSSSFRHCLYEDLNSHPAARPRNYYC